QPPTDKRASFVFTACVRFSELDHRSTREQLEPHLVAALYVRRHLFFAHESRCFESINRVLDCGCSVVGDWHHSIIRVPRETPAFQIEFMRRRVSSQRAKQNPQVANTARHWSNNSAQRIWTSARRKLSLAGNTTRRRF